ncbi:MAG: CDP-alcohol phosphatidyltransferase family protein [Gammaproteobacteria bacterium]|nr:CDP-alcohol phosphatidyltransferase family protein [Gammaproteobacteria bacterium]
MPTVYDFKPRFQGLLRPISDRLARAGITANQVTVAALLLSAVGGGALLWEVSRPIGLLALPLVLLVRMALNAIDGMLAREHGQQSSLGAVLNELGDVLSDIMLYLPFAVLAGAPAALIVGVVLAALLVEMTGVVGVQIGAGRRYEGPVGKSDRAVLFGGVGLLLGVGVMPGAWLTWLMALAFVLSLVTVVNRVRAALREVA